MSLTFEVSFFRFIKFVKFDELTWNLQMYFCIIVGNYLYMCVKNRTAGRYFQKYSTPMMRNVCTGEMLPVIFFYITYAMVLPVQTITQVI